ncbi:hypothetical protein F5X96DRAFT_80957 [Biscogniauxia mediterranea]|nr:hypothetical protein F5X96DRAFT_80957 [Biscogniauxia mediterranea]
MEAGGRAMGVIVFLVILLGLVCLPHTHTHSHSHSLTLSHTPKPLLVITSAQIESWTEEEATVATNTRRGGVVWCGSSSSRSSSKTRVGFFFPAEAKASSARRDKVDGQSTSLRHTHFTCLTSSVAHQLSFETVEETRKLETSYVVFRLTDRWVTRKLAARRTAGRKQDFS